MARYIQINDNCTCKTEKMIIVSKVQLTSKFFCSRQKILLFLITSVKNNNHMIFPQVSVNFQNYLNTCHFGSPPSLLRLSPSVVSDVSLGGDFCTKRANREVKLRLEYARWVSL